MTDQPLFSSLELRPQLLNQLQHLGFIAMTPIQAAALPHVLIGADVVAQASTGSGKTAAFGLGCLQHLQETKFHVQSLVLCPTRELADSSLICFGMVAENNMVCRSGGSKEAILRKLWIKPRSSI